MCFGEQPSAAKWNILGSNDSHFYTFLGDLNTNYPTFTSAATGNAPQISATGGDTNVDLRLTPKGTGNVKRGATGGSIDWWEEIGRTTLGSAGDTITVSSLPARKYLCILSNITAVTDVGDCNLRFNGDSGNNYAASLINNNSSTTAATSTQTSNPEIVLEVSSLATGGTSHSVIYVLNNQTENKIVNFNTSNDQGSTAASTAPKITIGTAKWVNVADLISSVTIFNGGAGDFAIGSEIVVLGHD